MSSAAIPSWASWLSAPPQTISASSTATVSSSSARPSAQGAYTSVGVRTSAAVSETESTAGWRASTRSTAPASTSVTTTSAPSSTSRSTSQLPTLPTPATPTVRPASDGLPQRCCAAARIPWNTPYAVSTEESPQPPYASDRPCAKRVSRATTSRSALYVPTSHAVRYRPPSDSTNRPYARSSASVLSVRGSPMITALPPPRS